VSTWIVLLPRCGPSQTSRPIAFRQRRLAGGLTPSPRRRWHRRGAPAAAVGAVALAIIFGLRHGDCGAGGVHKRRRRRSAASPVSTLSPNIFIQPRRSFACRSDRRTRGALPLELGAAVRPCMSRHSAGSTTVRSRRSDRPDRGAHPSPGPDWYRSWRFGCLLCRRPTAHAGVASPAPAICGCRLRVRRIDDRGDLHLQDDEWANRVCRFGAGNFGACRSHDRRRYNSCRSNLGNEHRADCFRRW